MPRSAPRTAIVPLEGDAKPVSTEEVAELRKFYQPVPKLKRGGVNGMSKKKPRALKVRRHSYLTEMDLRRIFFFRFGTEKPGHLPIRSYHLVGKLARLPASTCFYAIRRYERDGFKYVDRRRLNLQSTWAGRTKLKGDIAEYLLNHNVLTAWAGFSLVKLVHELSKLGVDVKPDTLSQFYKRNKVRYVVCKYQY